MSDLRPAKRIEFDEEANDPIFKGVETLARVVGITMGPYGRNVAMRPMGPGGGEPRTTKDGVTVANEVMLEDPLEDYGAQTVLQACRKTNDEAGDGTTATALLAHALLIEARREVRTGANSLHIQRGMQKAAEEVYTFLREFSKPVKTEKDLYNVAYISSQDKRIATQITEVMLEIGEYGAVNVDEGHGTEGIVWSKKDGMHFDSGYMSGVMDVAGPTDMKKLQWAHNDVGVIVIEDRIKLWEEIRPLIQACILNNKKKVLIVGDLRGDVPRGLVINKQQQAFHSCPVNIPFVGEERREILKDIAVYAGATFFSSTGGTPLPKEQLSEGDTSFLGCVDEVVVGKDEFTISGGRGNPDAIKQREELIEGLIKSEKDPYTQQRLKERLARFRASIGTLSVVASTPLETDSLRTRVDDAISAVRSANEEGMVPGGGVALIRARAALEGRDLSGMTEGERIGWDILIASLKRPAWQIADVAEHSPDVIVQDIMRAGPHEGYDYWQEKIVDMFTAGVVDPTKVVRLSVQYAVSVAGELLRTGASITELADEPSKENWREESKALMRSRVRDA